MIGIKVPSETGSGNTHDSSGGNGRITGVGIVTLVALIAIGYGLSSDHYGWCNFGAGILLGEFAAVLIGSIWDE